MADILIDIGAALMMVCILSMTVFCVAFAITNIKSDIRRKKRKKK